jgi:hypothetical protein
MLIALKSQTDYAYLRAVAESEKGYLLICAGPKGFHHAIECLEKALQLASGHEDTLLWKYDIGLAIRRNFTVSAYLDHPRYTARVLAEKAIDMFRCTLSGCTNEVYRARSLVEFSRLIQHLRCFTHVCSKDDKVDIENLIKGLDDNSLMVDAFFLTKGKEDDYFVLRECGRHFLETTKNFKLAVWCCMESAKKRETSIVYAVLARSMCECL